MSLSLTGCSVLTWLHSETVVNASSTLDGLQPRSMLTYVVDNDDLTDNDVDDMDIDESEHVRL